MSSNNKESDQRQPRPVHVTLSKDVKTGKDGQTEGMERQAAIVNLSPSICGTLMRAHPHSSSAVHHHGDQDTIVYAVSGHGTVVTSSNDVEGDLRQDLNPGDWALIPAYREHQEVNDGDEEVVWVIVRAPSGAPVVENLSGWGESRKGTHQ
ncbi:hypothetical protein, variant [Exophiala oligosperma]|uniref:Cupin type-2 domain-containing protein n=1 Tax=Exophiala oligosperma TaxID=215243 RepID=A0A0D2BUE4_9EURO|nr:uncharacterized protein PV06_06648 [Exophiala oligosperma]XP_016261268.1 hypothetical protein, variant [Exophiala oligosperma]KIW41051.1 hypothetical protein PV06_06648 [Exophiala oligosperma]KIW41052.1 hypothetical protein, variant [Exophiala oligosperma]